VNQRNYTHEEHREHWDKKSNTERSTELDRWYIRFLVEASWINRPRAWSHLLRLPVIDECGNTDVVIPTLGSSKWSPRTFQVLHYFIDRALQRGVLHQQPGGFYYMTGRVRNWLRRESKAMALTGDVSGRVREWLIRVHDKSRRFFERAYNQSGDVTALNYVFWHGQHQIRLQTNPAQCEPVIRDLARCLLENSWQMHSHLASYDQAYLLIRLMEIIKKVGSADLREPVLKSLAEIYEDNEDVRGGEWIDSEIIQLELSPDRQTSASIYDHREAERLHECQKVAARDQRLFEAVASGVRALEVLQGAALPPISANLTNLAPPLPDALARLAEGLPGVVSLVGAYRPKGPANDRTAYLIHSVLIRLSRSLVRLAVQETIITPRSKDSTSFNVIEAANSLTRAGLRILATHVGEHEEMKHLWLRYHTNRALLKLVRTSREAYFSKRAVHTLAKVELAESYASRISPRRGCYGEAVAAIQEIEILTWEARWLMSCGSGESTYDVSQDILLRNQALRNEARARQEAAYRTISETRVVLARARRNVVRWRDLMLARATLIADMMKLSVQHWRGLAPGEFTADGQDWNCSRWSEEERLELHRQCDALARTLQDAAFELRWTQANVHGDRWREVRWRFQRARILYYTVGILDLFYALLFSPDTSRTRPTEHGVFFPPFMRVLRAAKQLVSPDCEFPLIEWRVSADSHSGDPSGYLRDRFSELIAEMDYNRKLMGAMMSSNTPGYGFATVESLLKRIVEDAQTNLQSALEIPGAEVSEVPVSRVPGSLWIDPHLERRVWHDLAYRAAETYGFDYF
jgi:hypothetical protein